MTPLAEAIRRIVPCERCEWRSFEPARRWLTQGRRVPLCAAHVDAARGAQFSYSANAPEDLEAWDNATPEEREAALVEAFG